MSSVKDAVLDSLLPARAPIRRAREVGRSVFDLAAELAAKKAIKKEAADAALRNKALSGTVEMGEATVTNVPSQKKAGWGLTAFLVGGTVFVLFGIPLIRGTKPQH